MFAIYKPVIFLSTNLNLSTDILQHARFRSERRQSKDCLPSSEAYNHKRSSGSTSEPFSGKISRLLRYHDNGFLCLLFTILRLLINIVGLISQSMYSLLPLDRDPSTDEYINPMLRIMERMFIYNFFDQCLIFNKLIALHLLQTILMYSRNVYLKIINSKVNRYKYKKVNIVQVDMAYAYEIYSDFRGWLRIILSLGRHECRTRNYLQSERGKAMKRLTEQLRNSDRIDRLYYHNQIEFDDCFVGSNINVRTQSQMTGKAQDNLRYRWYDHLLRFSLPGSRPFVPDPGHRMDPIELSILVIIYIAGSSSEVISIAIGFISYMILSEQSSGAIHLTRGSRLAAASVGSLTFLMPLALTAFDCGLLCFCSLLCQSRARKLTIMLETELKAYRSLVEIFWLTVDKHSQKISCQGKSNLHWLAEHSRRLKRPHYNGSKYNPTNIDYHVCSLICIRNNYGASGPPVHVGHKHSLLEDLIDNFKKRVGERRIQEINSNISYLLDILEVLRSEHNDLRKNFTNYLNTNLIFSIPCLALSFTVITTLASSPAEIYLASVLAIASLIPITLCMFLGATSERSVSLNQLIETWQVI